MCNETLVFLNVVYIFVILLIKEAFINYYKAIKNLKIKIKSFYCPYTSITHIASMIIMLRNPSSKKRFLRTSLRKHLLWKILRNLLKPIKHIGTMMNTQFPLTQRK